MTLSEIRISLENIKNTIEGSIKQIDSILNRDRNKAGILPDFESLKLLLYSDLWPEAAAASQIADPDNEEDKTSRAINIIDSLLPYLKNKKFLDFGCGEGHVVKECLSQNPNYCIGYDIVQSGKLDWDNDNGYVLTTDLSKVLDNGPYDVILLCDVLDHAVDPVSVLKVVNDVSNENTTIIIKCHPWCSRHGGHLYNQVNKAFVHVVFSEGELNQLGLDCNYTSHILNPLSTYDGYFKAAGLKVVESHVSEQKAEPFFSRNPLVKKRIMDLWKGKVRGFPYYQMGQNFVSYILSK